MIVRDLWSISSHAALVVLPATAGADDAGDADAGAPVEYPRIQVLRPPVFPVGVVEAGSAVAVRSDGGGTVGVVSLSAGILRDLEGAVAVLTPLTAAEMGEPGTRIRMRVDRAIYDGRHLELSTSLRAEYDVSELAWSESAFEPSLTYQLGAVQMRAGGEGVDASLDHDSVELLLPLVVGAQFGAHIYVEAGALLVTGSGGEGSHASLLPSSLYGAFSLTPKLDLVAGISRDPTADAADVDGRLALCLGAFYRFGL